MKPLLKEIQHNKLLWLLAALLSHHLVRPATLALQATESVAAKTGDAVGGLLNATLGNLTELVIALWPGAVVMVFIATMTASLVTNSGRSTWFVGVLLLMVYAIFAMTLYLLPPRVA